MTKKWQITKEEFSAIQHAIESVLNLWQYEFIKAENEYDSSQSMSKETFFEALKREFLVEE